MNTSITPTAAVVATGLAGIAVFQMALAFGAPLGQAAWAVLKPNCLPDCDSAAPPQRYS